MDTSIGPEYAYRKTDGSFNNPCLPDLGKAGTPYSRSVAQTHPLPRNELPDPGLVFDTLLKREKVRIYVVCFNALVLTIFVSSSHTLPDCLV